MSELQLRIPTDSLRKLLQDNPAIMAKLESHAIEKISEEISRKTTTKDLKALTDTALKNTLEDLRRSMRDSSKWPKELQDEMKAMVMAHLKSQRVAMINEFRDELNAMYAETQKNAVASLRNEMEKTLREYRDNIVTIAKEGFFEVLKEARGQ